MDLRECYACMEGNYDEVMGRLMTESLVERYLKKFLNDKSCGMLCAAMEQGDYAEAFLHVHNLKGASMNLSFSRLFDSSNALCERLRGGEPGKDAGELLAQVEADYARVIGAIEQFAEGM